MGKPEKSLKLSVFNKSFVPEGFITETCPSICFTSSGVNAGFTALKRVGESTTAIVVLAFKAAALKVSRKSFMESKSVEKGLLGVAQAKRRKPVPASVVPK